MASILKLAHTSLADIPGQLRKLADGIEQGDLGEVVAGVVVLEHRDGIDTFMYGTADPIRAAGLMVLGSAIIVK